MQILRLIQHVQVWLGFVMSVITLALFAVVYPDCSNCMIHVFRLHLIMTCKIIHNEILFFLDLENVFSF